jgi:retron-type reverse transcriptase
VATSFDNIDWELLMRAVRRHTDCAWVLLYIERWLKAPVSMPDGALVSRDEVDPASRTTGVDFLIGNLAAPIC